MINNRYAYWPLAERPSLTFPNGARLAVWVILNVEHFRFDKPMAERSTVGPDISFFSERDYGNRMGFWRLLTAFDKYGIRPTVSLNYDICRFEPDLVAAGVERNWEWMGHGRSNSERLTGLDIDAERKVIRDSLDLLTQATGTRPRGWLSPGRHQTANTLDLLAEAGINYVGDFAADDEPIPLRVRQGRLIALPYNEISDAGAVGHGWTHDQFFGVIRDQFDVLYAEGEHTAKVLCFGLHAFWTGRPYRVRWLDRIFEHVTSRAGVWLATGSQLADWYYEHHYDEAVKLARLSHE